MPSWPASVPLCLVAGTYQERPRDNVARTAFDAGPVETRRRFTAVSIDISFTLALLTQAQKSALDSWYNVDLAGGALSFTADHPLTGEVQSFRFNAPPEHAQRGVKYSTRVELEQLP